MGHPTIEDKFKARLTKAEADTLAQKSSARLVMARVVHRSPILMALKQMMELVLAVNLA